MLNTTALELNSSRIDQCVKHSEPRSFLLKAQKHFKLEKPITHP